MPGTANRRFYTFMAICANRQRTGITGGLYLDLFWFKGHRDQSRMRGDAGTVSGGKYIGCRPVWADLLGTRVGHRADARSDGN